MLSLTEVVNDPDLGQPFVIIRSKGEFGPGGWKNSTFNIQAFGVIAPASDKVLEMIPEGDRVTGSLQVFSETKIYTTSEIQSGVSDKILWRGNYYSAISLGLWGDYGFWSAVMSRMTGS